MIRRYQQLHLQGVNRPTTVHWSLRHNTWMNASRIYRLGRDSVGWLRHILPDVVSRLDFYPGPRYPNVIPQHFLEVGPMDQRQSACERLNQLGAPLALSDLAAVMGVQATPATGTMMHSQSSLSQLFPQMISISSARFSDEDAIHFRCLTQIQWISMTSSSLGDSALSHLREMHSVRGLELGNTKVTDAGLIHISTLKGLRKLTLDGNQIGDSGMPHLANSISLEVIELRGTQITDAGLAPLSTIPSLMSIVAQNTRVTENGAARFLDASKLHLPDLEVVL